jgi:DNA-binding beta-propeller fold protein YncE
VNDITWQNEINFDIFQFLIACGYYKTANKGHAIITPRGKYCFVDDFDNDQILVIDWDNNIVGKSKATDPDGTTIRTNRLIEIVMEHERYLGYSSK